MFTGVPSPNFPGGYHLLSVVLLLWLVTVGGSYPQTFSAFLSRAGRSSAGGTERYPHHQCQINSDCCYTTQLPHAQIQTRSTLINPAPRSVSHPGRCSNATVTVGGVPPPASAAPCARHAFRLFVRESCGLPFPAVGDENEKQSSFNPQRGRKFPKSSFIQNICLI